MEGNLLAPRDVFDDLAGELAALDELLSGLAPDDWARESLCPGWTVADVVLHLAQSEDAVLASVTGAPLGPWASAEGGTTDDVVQGWVEAERGAPPEVLLRRWREARQKSYAALRDADPDSRVPWAAAPLKPRTLATTRLSEHWIHANDIALPLEVSYPDTDRIWNIARLAHRTIPYAFSRAGAPDPPSVRLVLTSPSGEEWSFGDANAAVLITGSASDFCRIAARRLAPQDAETIQTQGARADEVIRFVRTYA